MVDDAPGGRSLSQWLALGAQFLAPATVLGTLLFYFGKVFTRAQYEYFGVDVDTIGLSTQDFALRSTQALLAPLLLLAVLAVAVGALLTLVDQRASRAVAAGLEDVVHRLAVRSAVAGAVVLGAGVILLLGYPWFGRDEYYPLVTPVVLALGAGVTVAALPRGPGRVLRARVGLWAVLVGGVFWATATTADWSGTGYARQLAGRLESLPAVILDTTEDLHIRSDYVTQERLAVAEGERYRFRYRGLRLLIHGEDRMFLVPRTWSPGGTTLLVPLDDEVRVRFQFVNVPPA